MTVFLCSKVGGLSMRKCFSLIICVSFILGFMISCGDDSDSDNNGGGSPVVIVGGGGGAGAGGSQATAIATYLGKYTSGCVKDGDSEGSSQIFEFEITHTQTIVTVTNYAYEGDTVSCETANALVRYQLVQNFNITGEYNGGAMIETQEIIDRITPLNDYVTSQFNTIDDQEQPRGFCGYADWETGVTKEFAVQNDKEKMVVKRVGDKLYTNDMFDDQGNRLNPEDGDVFTKAE